MKTLTQKELELIADELNSLKNFEVQGIYGTENLFAIKLWNDGIRWVYISLKGAVPFVFGPDELIKLNKRLTKPVFVFFNNHFKQNIFKKASVQKEFGRVLRIEFSSDEDKEKFIEIRLYRGGVNFGVYSGDKKVFLLRPDSLELVDQDFKSSRDPRSLKVIKDEILTSIESKKNPDDDKGLEKQKEKKLLIAFKKIEESISFQGTDPYFRAAKTLEEGGNLESKLEELLPKNKTKQETLIFLYDQHKLKEQKIERLKRRLSELKIEISALASSKNNNSKALKEVKSYKPEIQGIPRISISPEITAFCGRKAKENLALIRKAKAWYLWMHLKDYPSAHVIIEKNKNKDLNEVELRKAANFLFFRGAPKKLTGAPEVSFEVIFTEVRHVKPVKGDKLGRVTAQNVKSRVYLWKKSDKFSI